MDAAGAAAATARAALALHRSGRASGLALQEDRFDAARISGRGAPGGDGGPRRAPRPRRAGAAGPGPETVASRQHIAGIPLAGDLLRLFGRDDLPARPLDLARCAVGPMSSPGPSGTWTPASRRRRRDGRRSRGARQAAIATGVRVLAGSAGLAGTLRRLHRARRADEPPARLAARSSYVAGSRHPATAAQVAALKTASIPVVRPARTILAARGDRRPRRRDRRSPRLRRSAVLTTAGLDPSERVRPSWWIAWRESSPG